MDAVEVRRFFNKPFARVRALQFLVSFIVWACVAHKCKPDGYCVFNNSHACNYAIGLGFFTLVWTCFLIIMILKDDVLGELRRTLFFTDGIASAMLTFLWFVCAWNLKHEWHKDQGPPSDFPYKHWSTQVVNNAQSAIFFSACSCILWGFSTISSQRRSNEYDTADSAGYQRTATTDDDRAPIYGNSSYQSA